MSKSNPRLVNPTSKFIEFKGDSGVFVYYDKEKEERVNLPLPIYFVVLDELSTVKGYSKGFKSGIYANEVRSVKDEILNVRSFKGGFQTIGKYVDIKDSINNQGAKFCKSVYAMLIVGKGQYELVNFAFHGASFSGAGEDKPSGWMNKKFNPDQYVVGVTSCEEGVNGNVTYQAPIFTKFKLTEDVNQAAIDMDRKLQLYFDHYFNQQIEKEITEAANSKENVTQPDEDFIQPEEDDSWAAQSERNERAERQRFESMRKEATDVKEDDGASDLPF